MRRRWIYEKRRGNNINLTCEWVDYNRRVTPVDGIEREKKVQVVKVLRPAIFPPHCKIPYKAST